MSVIKRTWAYGTRKAVKVIQAGPGVMTVAELAGKEAYVLVKHGVRPVPSLQARGLIEFTQGGPTSGYWKWIGN